MIETHGQWNPCEGKIVFAAGATSLDYDFIQSLGSSDLEKKMVGICSQLNKLHSMFDFTSKNWSTALPKAISCYKTVFLDSGVFSLAMQHAKRHKIPHNEALNTPIAELDGWNDHLDWYMDVCLSLKDSLWGYVELDLGGTEQKIKTRTWLEAQGLRPIPVWHPLTDGIDYGEYLMMRYDRICVGNLVKSDSAVRLRILRMMAHVKQHRETWIHALGLSADPMALSFPINSLDATSWMSEIMWPRRSTYALLRSMSVDMRRIYDKPKDRAFALSILQQRNIMNEMNWRDYHAARRKAAS